MVKIYERSSEPGIELDTFFDHLTAIRAPRLSEEFVDACARELARLGNNRNLIWNHLEEGGLARWGRSFSPPQSFMLGQRDNFAVRANIWLPPKHTRSETDQYYKRIYAYDLAHNHDFHFLTVGYSGPGYETDLYEVDAQAIAGTQGEPVTLSAHRHEQLTQGRVIYFQAYKDVHVQHEPSELSVSLNLVFAREKVVHEQLLFDLEHSRVIGPPGAGVTGRWQGVMGMAALLGDERTWEMLERLAENDPSARLRGAAREALRRGREHEPLAPDKKAEPDV